MDRQSAERLMLLVPQLATGTAIPGAVASAALTSRALWLAVDAYQRLVDRKTVASEAYIHLGQTYIRLAQPREALIAFRRADETAATPYEAYLARTLAGAALERVGRHADAMLAFLGALEAFPRAQSATLAVAPILFQSGQREQAADLLEAAVKLPVTIDPLQYYWVGDPEAPGRDLQQVRRALK
jgi:tetratricopeptide (TPR) repeat protein